MDGKKITRKRDSKGKVKLSDNTNGESSNSNHMNNEERPNSGGMYDIQFFHYTLKIIIGCNFRLKK